MGHSPPISAMRVLSPILTLVLSSPQRLPRLPHLPLLCPPALRRVVFPPNSGDSGAAQTSLVRLLVLVPGHILRSPGHLLPLGFLCHRKFHHGCILPEGVRRNARMLLLHLPPTTWRTSLQPSLFMRQG